MNWDAVAQTYRSIVRCPTCGGVTEENGKHFPCHCTDVPAAGGDPVAPLVHGNSGGATGQPTPTSEGTTMTPKPKTIDLPALVNELATIKENIEQQTERKKTIEAILIENLTFGTHELGGHQVQIRAAAGRIDAAKVAANHPFEQTPEIYKATIDTALVKHHLAPAELEGYKTYGQPTVSVK